MKMIFAVFSVWENDKRYAYADTIKVGENLVYHIQRTHCTTCEVCATREEANELARRWNEDYKADGTSIYN